MKPSVLILAGGIGKRFYPLTINKTMLPLLGKPLIRHTIDQLARVGIEQIYAASNSANYDYLSKMNIPGCKIITRLQTEASGMADAVLLFENEIRDKPMIIMNAIDTLDDKIFHNIFQLSEGGFALVSGYKMTNYFPGGYIKVNNDRAISLIEKPGEKNKPSDIIKLVIDYYSSPSELIDQIKLAPSKSDSIYEESLNKLMQIHSVNINSYDGYWQPLKYTHQILEIMDIYLNHRLQRHVSNNVFIAESASVEGNVYIDEGAKIFNNASVKGPSYIGRGAVVGDGALVRESVVEEGAVVGFGSEVTRSYIGPKCMLHHNFIGDSILESRVNPSYGTCFTNTRFDRKTVKIIDKDGNHIDTGRDKFGAIVADNAFLGANSTILPGRIIGPNKNCPPGSVVTKNVID